jgi:hypothetical protein
VSGERQRQVPEVTPRAPAAPAARLAAPRLAPWPRCPLLRRAKHVSRLIRHRSATSRQGPTSRASSSAGGLIACDMLLCVPRAGRDRRDARLPLLLRFRYSRTRLQLELLELQGSTRAPAGLSLMLCTSARAISTPLTASTAPHPARSPYSSLPALLRSVTGPAWARVVVGCMLPAGWCVVCGVWLGSARTGLQTAFFSAFSCTQPSDVYRLPMQYQQQRSASQSVLQTPPAATTPQPPHAAAA